VHIEEPVLFSAWRHREEAVTRPVEFANGIFSLGYADLFPAVMELDEQLLNEDSRSKQIVDDGVLGTLDIHLEKVDARVLQLVEKRLHTLHLQLARRRATWSCSHGVGNVRGICWRLKAADPVVIRNSKRVEAEGIWNLLARDPSDGARRGIKRMDGCVETPDQFKVERDVFPDPEGIYEWPVQKSFGANRPRGPYIP
jgi:hypothetical protein